MSYGQLIIITLCFSKDINALRAKNIEANKKNACRASISIKTMITKTNILPVGHQPLI